ncbi:hypothetical protein DWUX_364 [Desulfovibrio diazotrophicus]|nr:hypothetical protein DWUX_364 [Desulfovibrio diazotrophicus]
MTKRINNKIALLAMTTDSQLAYIPAITIS